MTNEPITLDEARTFVMYYTGWQPISEDPDDDEAREELLDRLRRLGLARALARAGVGPGDPVRVGGVTLAWE